MERNKTKRTSIKVKNDYLHIQMVIYDLFTYYFNMSDEFLSGCYNDVDVMIRDTIYVEIAFQFGMEILLCSVVRDEIRQTVRTAYISTQHKYMQQQ